MHGQNRHGPSDRQIPQAQGQRMKDFTPFIEAEGKLNRSQRLDFQPKFCC
jgi:hypothetical protein